MRLPKYPKYKDSEAAWLGHVPAHWECVRLASLFREVSEPGNDDLPILSVSIHDGVSDKELGEDEAERKVSRSDDRSKYKAVAPGDLTYNMMRAWQGGFGTVAVPGMVSPAYVVARPTAKFVTSHVELLLRTPMAVAEMKRNSRGITDFRLRLYWEDFKCIRIALPPYAEQQAIAAFLEDETAKIDSLISEQQKLIALLAEKRQATISHAVMRGLNPNARMTDSGVTCLGEVPSHWAVVPLKHLTHPARPIMYGIVLPGPDVEEGVPIVKGGDVKEHRLKVELLNRTTVEIEAPYARARLKPMDIVYSIRGTIGDAEAVPADLEDANITQDVARISPAEGVQTRWLLHVMKSSPVFIQLEQRSLGAAVRGINIFELKRARIPVPPSSERDDIANFLDLETTKFDTLKSEAEQTIRLLRERRGALIAAAVTGQVDVRGAATASTTTREELAA